VARRLTRRAARPLRATRSLGALSNLGVSIAALLAASCATTRPAPVTLQETVPPQGGMTMEWAAPAPWAAPPVPADPDLLIAAQIRHALEADPIYFFRHVDVQVYDGVAALSGYVWSSDAIYRARVLARAVPGVRTVVTSQLELERDGRGGHSSL
jgi:hypothetical protein